METKNLHYFLCVAECKSISKAAKKLYISQPTLSQHINKLESIVGVKFFDRTSLPLKLTYAGEHFVETATKILALEKNFCQEIVNIDQSSKWNLSIGISPTYCKFVLPSVLPKFKSLYPGVKVSLIEENAHQLESKYENRKIDILITNLPLKNIHLMYEVIDSDAIVLSVPANLLPAIFNPQKDFIDYMYCKDNVDISIFSECPFLLLKRGHRVRQIADNIFEKNSIVPKTLIESINIHALFEFNQIGMGITFIPRKIAFNKMNAIRNPKYPLYFFSIEKADSDYHMVILHDATHTITQAAQTIVSLIKKSM